MRMPGTNTISRILWVVAWVALGVPSGSCLREMPEAFPGKLVWNPEVALPLGEDRFGLNSVSGVDTSLLELDTITRLPNWINEAEVVMEGTLNFNFTSIQENLQNLNRILFRINTFNGFPDTIMAQAYFRDGSLQILDSMFREGPLLTRPGIPVGNGESIDPSRTVKDAVFNSDRIEMLEDATEIYLRATILVRSPDISLASYYPGYEYVIRIGAMLELVIEN